MGAVDPRIEELALQEELDRRRAQRSFLAYYMRMTGFQPPAHVRLICRLLQSLEDDRVDRAMIFAPPRHAKTLLSTKLFPSWVMGRHPGTAIMAVAHTERFAKKIGGDVRNLTRKPGWPWPEVALAGDSQAKDAFATPQGGEFNAFGMFGGNQHGNPAEWLFMDDIIKGRRVALSPHMREEAWETYRTDLLSRLQGRRKQLMVFTRWHLDDPAGRILPEGYDGQTGWYRDRETGERWFVLSLPAVAEHENDPLKRAKGEWLWPEAFGEDELGGIRRRGGWVWASLYQQHPAPQEGLMFQAEHIRRYSPGQLDRMALQVYTSHDYAVTDEAGAPDPDYTVHMVWGVDPEMNVYLLDMWRGRATADVWAWQAIRLWRQWRPLRAFEEGGQIIKSVGPFLAAEMQRERVYVDRVQLNSSSASGGKEQRAHALLGLASMGKLYLPKRAEVGPDLLVHLDAFEQELMQFPTGRHDDTVDAATLFGRALDRIIEGRRPRHTPGRRGAADGATLDDLWAQHDEEMRRREEGW